MSHPGELLDTAGSGSRAQVTLGSWSTPWALGHGPETPGISGRPREPSGTVPCCPGQLVHTAGPRFWGRVTWDTGSTLWYVRPVPLLPWNAGRHRGPSDPSVIRPEKLVEQMGPWTQARVTQDSWSTPQDLGSNRNTRDAWSTPRSLKPKTKSPGTPSRPGGISGTGPRGQDSRSTAGHQTHTRVARES